MYIVQSQGGDFYGPFKSAWAARIWAAERPDTVGEDFTLIELYSIT